MPGYELLASPTLYPGQVVHARLLADAMNKETVQAGIYLRYYGGNDELVTVRGPEQTLAPNQTSIVNWQIPFFKGEPIAEIGVCLESDTPTSGTLHMDFLTWEGEPHVTWERPGHQGRMWQRAWVDAG